MNRPTITVLIHTRNESAWIEGCLASVTWADEVVIADMASTDDTCAKAAARGARIIEVPIVKNVDAVRNQAIAQCRGDWVLVVDADERVSPGLAAKVRELATETTADAYALPRKNYLHDVWLEHMFWPDHQTRFFRRGKASWSEVVHQAPRIDGQLVQLPADPALALEHPGYCAEVNRFLQKSANYGRLELARFEARNETVDWLWLLRKPMTEFLGRYFNGGWRHGMDGLAMSLLNANYQLSAGLHRWEQQRRSLPRVEPATLRRGVLREIWRTALRSLRWLRPR